VYLLAWTAAGLFYFSQDIALRFYRTDPSPWQHVLANWMAGMWISAALTPAMLWLGDRWPVEKGNWARRGLLHLLFGSVFAVLEITLETPLLLAMGTLSPALQNLPFARALPVLLVYTFHGNLMRYFVVLGLQTGLRTYRQFRERENQAMRLQVETAELSAQLTGAHLKALQMQLQPHFLFNTLGAIMVLVRQGKLREAEEMLGKLSDLLRRVLEGVEEQEAPLWRELELVKLYLDIETVRFPDRLRVKISADDEALDALLPRMALQPLVENAIKHGLNQTSGAMNLEIRAEGGERLTVSVADDGPGLSAGGNGIGLSNTRARLDKLYGTGAALTVKNLVAGGVEATITVPFRLAPMTEREGACR